MVTVAGTVTDSRGNVTTWSASAADNTTPRAALDAYGICLVWQNGADYGDIPAVFAELDYLGVTTIRGRFQSGGRGLEVMDACAARGMRWLASFAPETFVEDGAPSRTTIRTKVRTWVREALDHPAAGQVLMGLENLNEPNSVRGGGVPLDDWPERCRDIAEVMLEERDAYGHTTATMPVTSPSMHTDDDDVQGAHWRQLATAGCPAEVISLHSYPFGQEILNRLDTRIANAHSAYPGLDVILSEHGWVTDDCAVTNGPQLVTQQQFADYVTLAPRQLYDHPDVVHGFLFELRDSMTGGYGVQDCRGLVREGVWKPAGDALRALYTSP